MGKNDRGRVMEQACDVVEQSLGSGREGKHLTVTHMALRAVVVFVLSLIVRDRAASRLLRARPRS